MKMRSLCFTLCMAACVRPAGALTLAGAEEAAAAANPAVKAALAALKGAQAALRGTSLPDPELSAETVSAGSESEVGLSQSIPLSGALGAERDAARAEVEAARLEAGAARAAVRAEARKAFHSAAIAGEKARFAGRNAVFALELLNKVEERVLAGRLGNADLLRARIELDRARLRQAEAEAGLAERLRDLNLLMGGEPGAQLEIEPDTGTFSLDGEAAPAPGGRLDLGALDARLRAAALRVRARRRRLLLPDLTLSAAAVKRDGKGGTRIGAGVALPLWGGARGGVLEAESGEAARAAEREGAGLLAAHERAVTLAALDLARSRARLLGRSLDAALELRRAAGLDYLSGKSQLTDYYEADRVFLESNLEYLEAMEIYHEAKANHEKAQAAPLAAGGGYEH